MLSAESYMMVVDMVVVDRDIPFYWCMMALLSAKCEILVADMVVVGRDMLLLLVYVDVVVVS